MKSLMRSILILSTLTLTTTLFAGLTSENCPPVDVIKNQQFKDTFNIGDAWMITSQPFNYENKKWLVTMLGLYQATLNKTEVLHYATDDFKRKILSPAHAEDDNCLYEDQHGLPTVIASVDSAS